MKYFCSILIILSLFTVLSCYNDEKTAEKRFILTSMGDGFAGYYITDGGDMVEFNDLCDGAVPGETYYKYANDLDPNDSSVYITVNGRSTGVTSIQLLIYDGDTLVVNETATPNEFSGKTTLSKYYAFQNSSSSSSSSSTAAK